MPWDQQRYDTWRLVQEYRIATGNDRAGSPARLHADELLSHFGAAKASAAFLILALTACQQAISTTRSAPSSVELAAQTVPAYEVAPPHPSAIVQELSTRSRIPTSELQQLLSECERTQLSMNICALRNFVASDLELDAVLKAKRESTPQQCHAEIDRAQAAWEAVRDKACDEETQGEEGGSMRPMLISSCKTTATRARILSVKEMNSCPGGGK